MSDDIGESMIDDIEVTPVKDLPFGTQVLIKRIWEESEATGEVSEFSRFQAQVEILCICADKELSTEDIADMRYGDFCDLLDEIMEGMEVYDERD